MEALAPCKNPERNDPEWDFVSIDDFGLRFSGFFRGTQPSTACFLFYTSFTIVIYDQNDSTIIIYDRNDSTIIIYDRNDSDQYYKTFINYDPS